MLSSVKIKKKERKWNNSSFLLVMVNLGSKACELSHNSAWTHMCTYMYMHIHGFSKVTAHTHHISTVTMSLHVGSRPYPYPLLEMKSWLWHSHLSLLWLLSEMMCTVSWRLVSWLVALAVAGVCEWWLRRLQLSSGLFLSASCLPWDEQFSPLHPHIT